MQQAALWPSLSTQSPENSGINAVRRMTVGSGTTSPVATLASVIYRANFVLLLHLL